MLTEEEVAAWDAFGVALQNEIEARFGAGPRTLELWLAIRDMAEITHMLKAAKNAARADPLQADRKQDDGL